MKDVRISLIQVLGSMMSKYGYSLSCRLKIVQSLKHFEHLAVSEKLLFDTLNANVLQAFLDFRGFDFRDFRFTVVYDSIPFFPPLVLLSNFDLHGFCFRVFFFVSPH